MNQTTLSLEGQPTQPKVESPTGFFLQTWQKGLLLVVILGILYLRIWRRKQAKTAATAEKRIPRTRATA